MLTDRDHADVPERSQLDHGIYRGKCGCTRWVRKVRLLPGRRGCAYSSDRPAARVNSNVDPAPTALSAERSLPCSSRILRAMTRPEPAPSPSFPPSAGL